MSARNMDEQSFSQEHLNPSTQGEGTAVTKLDLTQERARLEGQLDASSQETLKLHEELKNSFKRWEHEILEQKSLFSIQADEVTLLQQENRKFREVITILRSQVEQVVELQETVCESKSVIGKLRQEVNSLRSFRDEIMDSVLGVTVDQLYRDRCRLQEDLCKCQTQLESPKEHLKVKSSNADLDDNLLKLEGDLKLEQKVEMITGELCKGRASQHGAYVDCLQTTFLLESTAEEMFNCIATLSRFLSTYRNPGGHNPYYVTVVENELWKRTHEARDNHWTYLLKHFICLRLFENFQSETFGSYQGEVHCLAHEDKVRKCWNEYFMCWKHRGMLQMAIARKDNLDSFFFKYLASRFSALLPLELRSICEVFKNHDELTAARLYERLSCLAIDKQTLVHSLILAIEKVWQFHKLCLSFEPPVTLFRVHHGDPFNEDYMESINGLEQDDQKSLDKVGFVICPGFCLQKFILKCEVLLTS